MKISQVHTVFFSATGSTRALAGDMACRWGSVRHEHDITARMPESPVNLNADELLVVAVPSYGGRVPVQALDALNAFSGSGTPAVLVCVYGNRDYDDTLIELHDIVSARGFRPVAAAAIIAEHSIFPELAAGRPDARDHADINRFCTNVSDLIEQINDSATLPPLIVKGQRPYKKLGCIPLHPDAGRECNACGKCASLCPVQAIPKENPRLTNTRKCIACARCVHVCPRLARRFRGTLYKIARWKIVKSNLERKSPEFFIVTSNAQD